MILPRWYLILSILSSHGHDGLGMGGNVICLHGGLGRLSGIVVSVNVEVLVAVSVLV